MPMQINLKTWSSGFTLCSSSQALFQLYAYSVKIFAARTSARTIRRVKCANFDYTHVNSSRVGRQELQLLYWLVIVSGGTGIIQVE